jgi:serine/threonine protein kinase
VVMADHRLPIHESVSLIVKIANALDHAHSMGVVHRDLRCQSSH